MNYEGKPDKLENQIGCVKYTLFCFNIISWMFAASLFGLTLWIRSDSSVGEWITLLNLQQYYIGIYVLIGTSIIMMIVSFIGCVSALMENIFALVLFIGIQILGFVLVAVGSALLLDYSTMNSSIQPLIRDTMSKLIMSSEHPRSSATLRLIQENIGCCGGDGPIDYIMLRQPLPIECRDTITGNAFFHGCIDELTWYLEDKSGWIAGVAMSIAFLAVIDAVLSLILIQAIKEEEKQSREYQR